MSNLDLDRLEAMFREKEKAVGLKGNHYPGCEYTNRTCAGLALIREVRKSRRVLQMLTGLFEQIARYPDHWAELLKGFPPTVDADAVSREKPDARRLPPQGREQPAIKGGRPVGRRRGA